MISNQTDSATPLRTRTVPHALLPYVLSLAFMAAPVSINILFGQYFRAHPMFAPLVSILYLLAMIGSAWWGGYIAGVAVVISCVLISTYVGLGRLSLHDIPVLGISAFILIAVLVSSVAASRRRTEQILRSANEQLENKVRERTAELDRAKTWLEITLASIGDAVIATDQDGRVAFLNGVAEAMTGWSQQEASGRPLTEVFVIVNETTRASADDPVTRVLRTGAIAGLANHTVLVSRNGQEIPIDDSAAPIRDAAGSVAGVVLIFRDVTERRRLERAAEHSRLALERTNQELQQFAYAASHDLQEPLRNVSIYTQLLGRRYRGRLDGDADEFIGYAVNGALRMEVLLKDLLAYTQASRVAEPKSELTDANAALENVLSNLQAAVSDDHASISWDTLPTIPVDRVHLEQIFQNLIGNALKYRGDGAPKIHVTAAPGGTEWIFRVADNGIGIDPQYSERIFGIFKRLHTAEEYPGTGIGLAICRKLVQRYGGRIWVESELGRGSTFCFTLPAAPEGPA